MYDKGKEYIGYEFRKKPIETEYGITIKPRTLGNHTSNTTLERINQVIGNLVRNFNTQQTYVEKNYPGTGILVAAAFEIISTTNRKKRL